MTRQIQSNVDQTLLRQWNDTAVEFPQGFCVHQLFESQVERSPDACAVVLNDTRITYAELNNRANQLAHHLRGLGVGPEALVGVFLEHSIEMIVALLGIWKAGGAYLPMDLGYPQERLEYMLNAVGASAVLTFDHLKSRLPRSATEIIRLDSDREIIQKQSAGNPINRTHVRNLAYVPFTSGSTGLPKGVLTTHYSLANGYFAYEEAYRLRSNIKSICQTTSFSFGVFHADFVRSLCSGARLVLCPPDVVMTPHKLYEVMAREKVEFAEFVPAVLRYLIRYMEETGQSLDFMKMLVLGSDRWYVREHNALRKYLGPDTRLLNSFGLTETTVDTAYFTGTHAPLSPDQLVPIGRPFANSRVYILDEEMKEAPVGEPGEMRIGGEGLARGILNNPESTAERFIPDPFSPVAGGRMYKTNDLARYLPDGNIVFMGRADHQVKIRGFRVELGEIEAAIDDHQAVRENVVAAIEDSTGEKKLVAYVVPKRRADARLEGLKLCRLANGLEVAYLSKSETDQFFNDIFEEQYYTRHGISLTEGACVFDVGANIGMFSLFVHHRCRNATVYAFEPAPPAFEALKANTILYGVNNRLFNIGVSDSDRVASFTLYPESSGISSFYGNREEEKDFLNAIIDNQSAGGQPGLDQVMAYRDEILERRLSSKTIECRVRPLSEVIRENQVEQIDLLKITTQKSELDVLAGIEEEDWKKIKQIVLEIYDLNDEVKKITEILELHGFNAVVDQPTVFKGSVAFNIYGTRGPAEPEELREPAASLGLSLPPLLSLSELRQFLKEKLPNYMMPAAFVLLEALPLSPNGKVDRKSLPPPDWTRPDLDVNFVPPRNAIEGVVARIWAEALGFEGIGAHDNFFGLGGHSLTATQVISRLRDAFQVEMTVRNLFEMPTVSELAAEIERLKETGEGLKSPSMKSVTRGRRLPLSFAQQRLWFIDQMEPGNTIYNLFTPVPLNGPLNVDALERALNKVRQRHESLRTTFTTVDGRPVQVIHPFTPSSLPVTDLRKYGVEEAHQQAALIASSQAALPFDLAHGPLLRASLISLPDQSSYLLLCMHHIVSDAWSMRVLMSELSSLYDSFSRSEPSSLDDLPIQYADFAVWQRQLLQGPSLDSHLAYWKHKLLSAPALHDLPTDRPRPAQQSYSGASISFMIGTDLMRSLKEMSKREGVSLYMALVAAYKVMLYRHSGQRDIVIGTPVAGRNRAEVEGLIGFFVNTVVLRSDLSGEPSFREMLRRVKEVVLSAFEHQELPFDRLVEELRPQRDLSRSPIFQIAFDFQNLPGAIEQRAFNTGADSIETRTAKFDLTLFMAESAEGLVATFEYSSDLFDPLSIHRFFSSFLSIIESAIAHPDMSISRLPLLSTSMLHQILFDWNDSALPLDPSLLLHQLFEQRATSSPQSIALIFQSIELSYSQLNEQANQLAHLLIIQGVGPEVIVAIFLDKSIEMVVALLAVLKAGGAYLPLDPAYPTQRLSFMMEDAEAAVLITLRQMGQEIVESKARVICIDEEGEQIGGMSKENPEVVVEAGNAAYVIYTSGSSGLPKGAINTHAGICNRLLWMQETYHLDKNDCVLQKTPFSFDVSVWEFFWPLLAGARLVLAIPGGHQDSTYLVGLIKDQKITTLHFVPSMLQAFLEEPSAETCSSIKRVICSGEALSYELQERFFSRMSAELHNLYGPTEASVDVTFFHCRPDYPKRIVPIGRPIANTQIYILDEHLQPAHVGVAGELHIGGAGLARGYLNRPDLTAEKFIPNLYGRQPGERLYKTGDLARFLPDGNIEYLGRIDHQVKLRGFRVEMGEIESVLSQHPGILDCIVVPWDYSPIDKRLVGYIVPDGKSAYTIRQTLRLEREGAFREHQRCELPNGMLVAHRNKSETDFLYREIFEDRGYLKHGITLKEGDCVFDVGANIGLLTLFAALKCKAATVFAFEPIPPIFEALRINAALYGLNAKLFKCGISNEARTERFTYYPHLSIISGRFADKAKEMEVVKSFLLNEEVARTSDGVAVTDEIIEELLSDRLRSEQFDCEMETISSIIRRNNVERIDLLKIDVEKSEMDALRGIEDEDWPKIMQVVVEVHEIDDRLEQVTSLLEGRGFDLTVVQDTALKDTGLYNIYAKRGAETGGLAQPEHAIEDDELEADEDARKWASPGSLVRDARQFLSERLPEYMIPSAFVLLEALPLSPNGKVDRRALPAPEPTRSGSQDSFLTARSPVEELLASIWAQALSLDQVGVDDNFFEMGGHSLLATQIVSRIREAFKVEMAVRTLFQSPTVAALAKQIESIKGEGKGLEAPPIIPVRRDQKLPLSFAQQRLWFLHQMEPDSPVYNISAAIRVPAQFDVGLFSKSLKEVRRRHESLRTTFALIEGHPVQIIGPAAPFEIQVHDLRKYGVEEAHQQASMIASSQAALPFDLAHGPLLRASLIAISDDLSFLLLCMHHIVSDAWSMRVLMSELSSLYDSFSRSEPSSLDDLPIQYADFAVWQRQLLQGPSLDSHLAYWKRKLLSAPALHDLPTDRPRPAQQSYSGASISFMIGADLMRSLKEMSKREGVSLYMALVAAYKVMLYRHSGQRDIVIGTPVAGRNRAEVEGLIGFFVNTVVLRSDLSGEPNFREVLRRVKEVVLSAFEHQELPFDRLVEELNPERRLSYSPLFQLMFAHQNLDVLPESIFGGYEEYKETNIAEVSPEPVPGTTKFDLTLSVIETSKGLVATFEYSSDLFDPLSIHRFFSSFLSIIESAIAQPVMSISRLPLLSASMLHQILFDWNDSALPLDPSLLLHQLFEQQAISSPQSVALIFQSIELTYSELNERANQLAHLLIIQGVGPEVIVAIFLDRSVEMVVALLAVLKAGGAYLPLDPAYPAQRLSFMMEDAEAAVLITLRQMGQEIAEGKARVICIDEEGERIGGMSKENPEVGVEAGNAAYVIYTSGSSGLPKGVVITHRGVCNSIQAQAPVLNPSPDDIVLQFSSLSFDASVFETFLALQAGAALCLGSAEAMMPGPDLVKLINQHNVSTIIIPPSALTALMPEELPSLRKVAVAGEACPQGFLSRWAEGRRLFNAYGPTEVSIWCSVGAGFDPTSRPPIGRPISNARLYILDSLLQPAPIGTPGELYIGGVGVGRGYLNRPDLTAERFIPDPFSAEPGMRIYRSGDLARYLPDGNIEFVGRIDQQVKLRGFRIELGEIEAALNQHPSLRESVVVAREDANGDKWLVAYVVLGPEQKATPNDIRSFISQLLPYYMVPSLFVNLESLPLTPNGKVDRRALPAPEPTRSGSQDSFLTARSPVEELLASIWAQALSLDQVGVDDNFFEMGGHSLLATQIVSRIREAFKVEMAVRTLFQSPTVAALAKQIEIAKKAGLSAQLRPILRASRDGQLPLTYGQQRLWLLDQLEPGSASYNISTALRLRDRLNIESLESSVNEIARRHEILRTSFAKHDGAPVQVIMPFTPAGLQVTDLRSFGESERKQKARQIVADEAQRPFELDKAPLFRVLLVRLAEEDHLFILTMHHIISDGWSLNVFLYELRALYESIERGDAEPLPEPAIQYADYAVWQRLQEDALEPQFAYWKKKLENAPMVLELPADRPRPQIQTNRGATHHFKVDENLTSEIKLLSRREDVTLFMTMLAALESLLHRLTNVTDMVVGTDVANRTRGETEGLIGLFINQVVLRTDLSGDPTFRELLKRVREVTLEAYAHQEAPFEKLVEKLELRRSLRYAPLIQVKLILQNLPAQNLVSEAEEEAEESPVALEDQATAAQLDLTLYVAETSEGMICSFVYNSDLFDASTIARMSAGLLDLLREVVADTGARVGGGLSNEAAKGSQI